MPASRGMIFGAKVDGDRLEYRVWANGVLLGVHNGAMRKGVFWQDYAEGYRNGKLVAREHDVHDDAAKRSKVTTEDLDPDNGEVIRVKEASVSYLPPKTKPEDEIDMDDDDDGLSVPPVKEPATKGGTPPAPQNDPGK